MLKQLNWKKESAIFITAQAISRIGSAVVGYSLVWYLTLETSSGLVLALGNICNILPDILISPFAGVWADKYNKKKIIMIADASIAVTTLILFLLFRSGNKSLPVIFFFTALRSIGSGIQAPSVSAFLPQIVPKEQLPRINAVNSVVNSVAQLAPPALGALIFASLGIEYSMLLDTFTAFIGISMMFFVSSGKNVIEHDASKSIFSNIKEGLAYVKQNDVLRTIFIFFFFYYFLMSTHSVLPPLLIERTFGSEAWRLSLNEVVWIGGNVVGGIIIFIKGRLKNKVRIMVIAMIFFGAAFGLQGTIDNFNRYLIVTFVASCIMPIYVGARTQLIQEEVPLNMMGRIFSLLDIMVLGNMMLGMAIFGPLSDVISVRLVTVFGGGGIVVIGFMMLFNKHLKPEIFKKKL